MSPYDAPTGSVWDFEGELFVMLDEKISLRVPYRRYVSLDTGQLMWMGQYSYRDGSSEPVE